MILYDTSVLCGPLASSSMKIGVLKTTQVVSLSLGMVVFRIF